MATSEKIEFQNRDGLTLAAALELPSGRPRAYAVFAHCFTCSKDVAAARHVSRALRARGFAVLRFDFTGLGGSAGDFSNTGFTSNVDDLVAAADHLRERAEAPLLLVGHSLGGAAVLAAAPRIPEVRAVVTIGAPSDPQHVTDLFRCELDEIEAEGSAPVQIAGREFRISRRFVEDVREAALTQALSELDRALLILHSPQDAIVGIEHARTLYQAARHPKSFVSLDGMDHLLSRRADGEYAAEVIAAWSSRYVKRDGGETEPRPRVEAGEVVVRSRPGSRFTQDVSTTEHVLTADEPPDAGGDDLGPTPYGYLLGALGACTNMTLRMDADRKGWPLDGVTTRLRHDRVHARDCEDCDSTEGHVDVVTGTVALAGPLDEAQRRRLMEIAGRCPVHRTLTTETRIELDAE